MRNSNTSTFNFEGIADIIAAALCVAPLLVSTSTSITSSEEEAETSVNFMAWTAPLQLEGFPGSIMTG